MNSVSARSVFVLRDLDEDDVARVDIFIVDPRTETSHRLCWRDDYISIPFTDTGVGIYLAVVLLYQRVLAQARQSVFQENDRSTRTRGCRIHLSLHSKGKERSACELALL